MKTPTDVLEAIRKIIREKENARKHPTHALFEQDFLPAVKLTRDEAEQYLAALADQGKIKVGDTINDRYILLL